MCAICGVVHADTHRKVDPDQLQRMADIQQHRGPDGEGFATGPGFGLGIRRLSIIDLKTGDQPISNEDGSITVVCNGEIYNYKELRATLIAAGHQFRTDSDVEVIVHLYEEYGTDCVSHLRGMFGFALWDRRQRRLMLARDRLGIKPLYYALAGDTLLFASEMKAIMLGRGVRAELNARALGDLFSWGFVRAPRTLCQGIHRLLPGHWLVYEAGRICKGRYWNLRFPIKDSRHVDPSGLPGTVTRAEDWAEALNAKLKESVHLHMRGDVPVGAWLSAGIDSSAIASLMSRTSPDPVQTFSLGFEDAAFDETAGQRLLGDFDGYEFVRRSAICGSGDFSLLSKSIWHSEDPFVIGLEIPRMLISRLAAESVKVVLTGEGADELLGGYPWYRACKAVRPLMGLPQPLRKHLARMPGVAHRSPLLRRALSAPAGMSAETYRQIVTGTPPGDALFSTDLGREIAASMNAEEDTETLPPEFSHWDYFSQMQYLDISIRLPDFITRSLDASSMAYSLEARVPFLDHELVELCARIPPRFKMRWLREKHVLRQALHNDLPAEILNRKKRGLGAPRSQWLRDKPEYTRSLLTAGPIRDKGYFDPETVTLLLERHLAGVSDYGSVLMGVIGVQLWDDLFVRKGAAMSR